MTLPPVDPARSHQLWCNLLRDGQQVCTCGLDCQRLGHLFVGHGPCRRCAVSWKISDAVPAKPVVVMVPPTIPNIQDLAAGLRRVADAIEQGQYPDAKFGVWVLADAYGQATTGVFGPDVDRYRALGILQAGLRDVLP